MYCPGHAGIDLNETADRLATRASGATSRIALSASDIRHLLKQRQRETQALVSHGSTEGREDARERTGARMGAAFSPLRSDREAGVSAGVRHDFKEDAG